MAVLPDSVPERAERRAGPGRGRDAAVAVLLALLVVVVFSQALTFGFLPWDDDTYLLRNPAIRAGLTPEAVRWSFGFHPGYQYYPLTWLSHALDFSLFGDRPAGHHATSVAIHALATALFFLFLSRATGARGASALAAAFFGVHPLRSESVAWVAERKDVLSVAFAAACLVVYLRWARGGRPATRAAVLGLFLAGLLAKPMLVSFPLLLLLVDAWPLLRVRAGEGTLRASATLVVEKLPYLLLAAAAAIVAVAGQNAGGGLATIEASPLGHRLSVALYATAWYVGKTIVPRALSAFYPLAPVGAAGVAAGLGTLVLLLALAASRRAPLPVRTGALWYLVALAPVSGLVRIGDQLVADRYSYLPSFGLAVAVVFGARELLAASRRPVRVAAAWAGVVAVASYATVTAADLGRFHDGRSLFSSAVETDPKNWLAHLKLGEEDAKAGRWHDARTHYDSAYRLRPEWDGAAGGLAQALARVGETGAMSAVLEDGLRRNPSSEWLHRVAADLYERTGETARAAALRARADALRRAAPREGRVSGELTLAPFRDPPRR